MRRWFTEVFRDTYSLGLKAERVLDERRSPFQRIAVFETAIFGKVLTLDGVVMTSERDEHHYHEMIVHPALTTAPSVRRVLIIGGGDGGTAREVLRHEAVEQVVMVEIDREVVEVSKAHLPEIGAGAWSDPRLELRFADGVRFVEKAEAGSFDVVILDGSDPIGPAEGLFDRAFYEGVRRALTPEGVFALQSEAPILYADVFYEIQATLREVFGRAQPYFGTVPLYGAGMWTWTYASRSADPLAIDEARVAAIAEGCRYYSAAIHRAAFVAPAEIARLLVT